MDFIHPDQLYKYEYLMDEINQEYKKCEDLKKKLIEENNKIIIHNVSASRIIEKIAHLEVKVFSDILELFALYDDELSIELKQFLKNTHHKFYLIEVHITKALLQKISGMNCIINMCVSYDETLINKSMKLTSNSTSPLLEVIPVDQNIVNCTVESILLTDQSMMVKLDAVHVDISYHFQAYDKKRKPISRVTSILQVAKRYNEDLTVKELNEKLFLDYKFKCHIDTIGFLNVLLKNSYHYLASDLFTELISCDKNDFTLQLSLGTKKYEISYSKNNKIGISAPFEELAMLKKYFHEMVHQIGDNGNNISIEEFKNSIPVEIQDTRQYYNDIRKCWSSLPILHCYNNIDD